MSHIVVCPNRRGNIQGYQCVYSVSVWTDTTPKLAPCLENLCATTLGPCHVVASPIAGETCGVIRCRLEGPLTGMFGWGLPPETTSSLHQNVTDDVYLSPRVRFSCQLLRLSPGLSGFPSSPSDGPLGAGGGGGGDQLSGAHLKH